MEAIPRAIGMDATGRTAGNQVANRTQTTAVVVSMAVVLKEATSLVTKAKSRAKVAEEGNQMLVVAVLIVD